MGAQDDRVRLGTGVEVQFTDEGSGEALLCLHVLGSTRAEWALAREPFAREHRFVAPDLPGFGASDAPAEHWPVGAYARAMFELLDRRGIRKAHVVGHSFGAVVATEMAASAPERVGGLVLCSPPGGDRETTRKAFGLLLEWVRDDGRARMVSLEDARAVTEMASEGFMELANMGLVMGRGFLPALAALAGYPYEQRARAIKAPTLVVWGSHDRLVPVADGATWRSWIPGARLEVLEGTGHSLCFEQADRFNSMVLAFLRGLRA